MVFVAGLIWWIADASVGTLGHPLCCPPLPLNTRLHSSRHRHGGAEQVTISYSKQSPCLNLPPVAHLRLPPPHLHTLGPGDGRLPWSPSLPMGTPASWGTHVRKHKLALEGEMESPALASPSVPVLPERSATQ